MPAVTALGGWGEVLVGWRRYVFCGGRSWVWGRKDSDYPSRPSAQGDVIKAESLDLLEARARIRQERPRAGPPARVSHVIMV
jgi:hypothetical protein